MNLKSSKVIQCIAIIIVSLGIVLLSITSTSLLRKDPVLYKDLLASYIYLFNLSIFLSWMICGIFLALGISAVSFATAILIAAGSQMNEFYLLLCTLVTAALVGLSYARASESARNKLKLDLETLEEQNNVLQETLSSHRALSEAYDKRCLDLTKLKSITEKLSSSLKLQEIISSAIGPTCELIRNCDRCLVYMVDTKKQSLWLAASRKSRQQDRVETKKGDIFDQWVFKHRQPLLVTDAENDFRFALQKESVRKRDFESLISCPLVSEGKVLGIVRIDNPQKDAFSTYELSLLDKVAALESPAVHNALLYQEQEELAIRDGLTGLYLPRYFKERFKTEFQRSLRKGSSLSLLMIDIDDFKKYNDSFGHSAGDILLRHLSKIFSSCVDAGDLVARYGGEEFAVLFADTDKKKAMQKAEAIRAKVAGEKFVLRRQTTIVTISVGVASYPDDTKYEDELLRKADEALYNAKKKGKNRVCQSS